MKDEKNKHISVQVKRKLGCNIAALGNITN